MEYEIGDKVRIRNDLKQERLADGVSITGRMLKYAGKEMIIRNKWKTRGHVKYNLVDSRSEVSGVYWSWSPLVFKESADSEYF